MSPSSPKSPYPGVRPDQKFQRLERDQKFRGRFVGVSVDRIVLPSGHKMDHEVVHLPSAVCVVPLLAVENGGIEVVLVEQFRNSVGGYIHEIPAGILEEGEDPATCAARELIEETGYRAARLTHLVTLCPIPGVSDHRMHFFMAEGLSAGEQQLEPAECLTVRRVPLRSLLTSVLAGGQGSDHPERAPVSPIVVVDAKTHLGLLQAVLVRGAKNAEEILS